MHISVAEINVAEAPEGFAETMLYLYGTSARPAFCFSPFNLVVGSFIH